MELVLSKVKILKYSLETPEAREEAVASEVPLEIQLQGQYYQYLLYLPGQEKELALGFLFTAGVIGGLEDIAAIHFYPPDPEAARPLASVEVWLNEARSARHGRPELPLALLKAGPGPQPWDSAVLSQFPPRERRIRIKAAELVDMMLKLSDHQPIFHQTGATHAAAVADLKGEIILSAEDVGRHNAFDKVIGRTLLERIPLNDKIALLSGRVSYEMAFKAGRAGIPLLAAVSAPTHLAIRLADALGITLAGFVRDRKMNIYTHPERLSDLSKNIPE